MKRILVIRGGAIGDFILTLPALKLLRDGFPDARIEILGYKHIVALAENRFYAQATRSIEYGPLASFFSNQAELAIELIDYFAGFDLIVSYLFDPDQIFEANVRSCGVGNFIFADPKIDGSEHAARQLARPLEQVGLKLMEPAAELYLSEADRRAARDLVGVASSSIIALHPGSGSATKNWPFENWIALGNDLLSRESRKTKIVVVGGEADEIQLRQLEFVWNNREVFFAKNLPLPALAALLEHSLFVGHDSGISHLAAAAGARCILLFGPTEPAIWAPENKSVTVLQAPKGDLRLLTVDKVIETIEG
jgi:ADP-heptose:LPS heptosyltransferase